MTVVVGLEGFGQPFGASYVTGNSFAKNSLVIL